MENVRKNGQRMMDKRPPRKLRPRSVAEPSRLLRLIDPVLFDQFRGGQLQL